MPYNELPIRVNRIAFREFSRDPALTMEEFKKRLGREIFGEQMRPMWLDDLLLLHQIFFNGRTWCQPPPLASPKRMKIDITAGRINSAKIAEYRRMLEEVREIAKRHENAESPPRRELHQIAKWITDLWEGEAMKLLQE